MKKSIYFMVFCLVITFFDNVMAQSVVREYGHLNLSPALFFTDVNPDLKLSLGTEMKQVSTYTDQSGTTHTRYHQYHNGFRVVGASVILHSKENVVQTINGHWYSDNIELSKIPTIEKSVAVEVASTMMQQKMAETNKIQPQQVVKPTTTDIKKCYIDKDFPKHSGQLVLAYEISQKVSLWQMPTKMTHYIDASNGQPITSFDKVTDHKVKGTGVSNFYGTVTFDHDSIGPKEFHLRDLSRGDGIFIRNIKTGEGYKNDKNHWNFAAADEKSGVDVIYGAQKFYDMLKNKFNYNSIDNKGFNLIGNVNYAFYGNAYWDGETTTYGGGDCNEYFPFTSLDVVGHEFAHGLTEFNSGLAYRDESGALNESMSDIFGKSLEYYIDQNNFTWLIGDAVARPGKSPFRSMADPTQYNCPKYYKGYYWSEFWFAVHTNSGVLNHWYYLLVNGGMGTNEGNQTYNVSKIGIDKALEHAFLLNTAYFTETTTYPEAFEYSKSLAKSMYGEASAEYKAILEAWKAVGLLPSTTSPLNFTIKYNSIQNNEIVQCATEKHPVEIVFTNISNTVVPKGATVDVKLNSTFFIGNSNQSVKFHDKKFTLNEDLKGGDSIVVQSIFEYGLATSQYNGSFDLAITGGSSHHFQNFTRTIKFKENKSNPADKFEIQNINNVVNNFCDKKSPITYSIAYFNTEICEAKTYDFIFDYKIGASILQKTLSVKLNPSSNFDFGSAYLPNPVLPVNTETSEITLDVYYQEANQKYLLGSDTLKKKFIEPLKNGSLIDFSNITDETELNTLVRYAPCFYCDTYFDNEELYLENQAQPTLVNDCVDLDEFYEEFVDDDNFLAYTNMSFIDACINTIDMKEPYIKFESKVEALEFGFNSDYSHGIKVLQDDVSLTKPAIYEETSNLVSYEFPLKKSASSKLSMFAYLTAASATLDNILIYDKFQSSTHDQLDDLGIKISNPASDQIIINIDNPVFKNGRMTFYDLNSKPIHSYTLPIDTHSIDCSVWPAGIYFYQVSSQNTSYSGKLVVVK